MKNDLVLGTLRLSDDDARRYKAALKFYGINESDTFLIQCAYALFLHAERGDDLLIKDGRSPLIFKHRRKRIE
jgi:hypothetical protein